MRFDRVRLEVPACRKGAKINDALAIGRPEAHFPRMDRIELNPEVCNGKPVVRGTRITVQTILGFLSAGDSVDDVLVAYPQLSRDDVLACLEYARRLSEIHSVVRLAS
jgi:uncharacterized protein (DUF433 family)